MPFPGGPGQEEVTLHSLDRGAAVSQQLREPGAGSDAQNAQHPPQDCSDKEQVCGAGASGLGAVD